MTFKQNTYEVLDDKIARILLSKGYWTLVDLDNLARLLCYRWYANVKPTHVYARSNDPNIYMQKLVMYGEYCPTNFVIDHINRNGLDNRRSNLRYVSNAHNMLNAGPPVTNTSGYRGVWFDKEKNKWAASITTGGRTIHLGRFDTPEEASEVYEAKRTEILDS